MSINYFHNQYYNQTLSNKYEKQVHSYLDAMCKARNGLIKEKQYLALKDRLRPVECDTIVSQMRTLLDAVRNFEELLNNDAELPRGAAPKRYKVYMSLNYTEQHIRQILPVLSAFRSICLEATPKTWEMLAELRQGIDTLIQISAVLEPETKEMLSKTLAENVGVFADSVNLVDYQN